MELLANEKIVEYDNMIEHLLYDFERKLDDYYIKLFYEGISIYDLKKLEILNEDVKTLAQSLKHRIDRLNDRIEMESQYVPIITEWNHMDCGCDTKCEELKKQGRRLNEIHDKLKNIMYSLSLLIYEISKNIQFKKIPRDDVEYILENTSLLHLVFTNNTHPKIRRYSSDSHMFLCQFHKERTPSFGVTSYKNKSYCFGCGFGATQLGYIINYERITYIDAVYLLAEVYMIEIKDNPYKNNELVDKYRKTLLSDEYMMYLTASIERAKSRSDYALKWYKMHINTINRIKNGIVDKTISDRSSTSKVYKINMPEFRTITE